MVTKPWVAGATTARHSYSRRVTFRLYDSAQRTVRDFVPVTEGKASIYICGLTVQGAPHIGHVRFTVAFDQLRRWLTRGHGLDVTLVRNVTDIEDKILNKSRRAKRTWWEWAYLHELQTNKALEALGVLPPTYEPRATGHMPEVIELCEQLIERGHAYVAEDGSGDVYFDVRSWADYGSLTRQDVDDLAPAGDGEAGAKKDPRDFALWKGRPEAGCAAAAWNSPFGPGRPGWHIECSAMAHRYLGEEFDIHGGGVDLRFPHHENELAQSNAAGHAFARYWMHNAWVTMSGEKMSKSLGNSVVVLDLIENVRPLVLRYYLGSAQYRSTIEYAPDSLTEADSAVTRLEGFMRRASENIEAEEIHAAATGTQFPEKFRAVMDDDLNVSGALAVVYDTVRAGNSAIDSGDTATVKQSLLEVAAMTDVLGVNPLSPQWAGNTTTASTKESEAMSALDNLINLRLEAREKARANKDFTQADAIRDELTTAGVVIEDSRGGARWRFES